MQPDNENLSNDNLNVAPPPVSPPQPPQQYVQPQPVQMQPQPAYSQPAPSGNYVGGYFNTLKTLFTNPKSFFDNPPTTFLQSIIFPAVNLVIMLLVLLITTILSVLTSKTAEGSSPFDKLSSDFWGQLFKSAGLSALYVALFLAVIAGIIYVFALVAKKNAEYKDILSMSSIFSLNFLAVALTAIIGLAFSWVDNADFSSVIGMISGLIASLVFVYATVMIIQGISSVTEFNIFKSTAIFVISSLLVVFIAGKIVTDLPKDGDFGLSFGNYSNSVTRTNDIVNSLRSLQDMLNSSNY